MRKSRTPHPRNWDDILKTDLMIRKKGVENRERSKSGRISKKWVNDLENSEKGREA